MNTIYLIQITARVSNRLLPHDLSSSMAERELHAYEIHLIIIPFSTCPAKLLFHIPPHGPREPGGGRGRVEYSCERKSETTTTARSRLPQRKRCESIGGQPLFGREGEFE